MVGSKGDFLLKPTRNSPGNRVAGAFLLGGVQSHWGHSDIAEVLGLVLIYKGSLGFAQRSGII